MAGPGARIVDRVGVAVIPDTSKFLPSLKKYLARIEHQLRVDVQIGVDPDGLSAKAKAAVARAERSAGDIEVYTNIDTKGLATKVAAASLRAQRSARPVKIPVEIESSGMERALANMQGSVGSLGGGMNPAVLGAIAALLPFIGGLIAALPALIMSIAAPIAVIVAGFEGIKRAAQDMALPFAQMRATLAATFEKSLTPAFAMLAGLLPKITPQLQQIAIALSGAFTAAVGYLTSPQGLALLQSVLAGVAAGVEALKPLIGPMIAAFLQVADVGMKGLIDAAPFLIEALTMVSAMFGRMAQDGTLQQAVQGFGLMLSAILLLIGGFAALLAWLSAGYLKLVEFGAGVASAVNVAITWISTLPGRAAAAIGAFIAGLTSGGRRAMDGLVSALPPGIARAVGILATLPGRVIGVLAGLASAAFASGASLVQGLINGIMSRIGAVAAAASAVAARVRAFFPGSPVKEGPLTSWNNGGAGKRLGGLLADGLDASQAAVAAASARMASAVSVGSVSTYIGSSSSSAAGLDPGTIRAALDGATLRLGPVDSITREVTAQLVTAYSRSV